MAVTADSVVVELEARLDKYRADIATTVAQFEGGMNRIERSALVAEGAANRAGAGISTLTGFAKSFVAGIGIETIARAGKAILDYADDIDASARQAGIAVERYQTLKEGLRSLEVDAGKVDLIFGSLTDTLGAVQAGTAGAGVVDVLDRMGIKADILNGNITTTDQLLDAIAGSASRFKTEAEFTNAVVDLTNRRVGVELAAALRDGGVALKGAEQAFRDTGSVIDAEFIKKLADSNEAIDAFATRARNKLAIFAANAIDFFDRAGDAADEFADRAAAASPVATDYARKSATARNAARDKKTADANELNAKRLLLPRLNQGTVIYDETVKRIRELTPQAEKAARETPIEVAPEIVVTGSRSGRGSGGRRSGASSRPAAAEVPAVNLKAKLPSPDVTIEAVDRAGLFAEASREAAAQAEMFNRVMGEAATVSPQIAADLAAVSEEAVNAQRAADQFSKDLSYGLADAIINGKSLGDVLVDSFKRAAVEALASGIFNLIGGAVGSVFGGGLGGLFGGARAIGGPVTGRTPYLVGEKGPELFVPNSNGRIKPAGSFGGDAVSVYVSQSLHFDVGLESVDQRISQAAPLLVGAAQRGTIEALRNAGIGQV